jgi:hypothetical protein
MPRASSPHATNLSLLDQENRDPISPELTNLFSLTHSPPIIEG